MLAFKLFIYLLSISAILSLPNNISIVTFVGADFLHLFFNWIAHVRSVCAECEAQIHIVCMDEVSKRYLKQFSISCTYLSIKNSVSNIPPRLRVGRLKTMNVWMARMDYLILLLKSGSNILISDVDAVWLRNPMSTLLNAANDSDIIASKGWFPIELYRLWGSTLCLGFAYFKSSSFTIELLEEVSSLMKNERLDSNRIDDQYSINKMLHSWGVSWNKGARMSMSLSGNAPAVADSGVVIRAGREHIITLLAHRAVLRNCLNDSSLFPEHRYNRPSRTLRKSLTAWLLSGWREWTAEEQMRADLQYAGASSALTLSLRGNSQQLFLPPRGASPNNHSELGQGTTIVAHCITPTGRSSAKMLFLQQVGLWNDSAITLHNYAEDIPQIQ